MAEKLNWGVLGAGGIAYRRTIPEGIMPADNGRLVAVMDVLAEAAEKVGKQFGAKVYVREDDLLADPEVEAVYVATPACVHFTQTMKCLKAGKHVLIEKPMALKVSECEKILQLAKKKKLKVGIDFMMRFHRHHQKMKEMVANGEIGKPVMARAQLSCWYPPIKGAWRQVPKMGGGGSFIDMGCHCIDILEFILGTRVKEVTCLTGRIVQKYPVEDSAVMTCRFANGALGIVDACFSIPDNSSLNVLELYGSLGSILAKGTIGQMPTGQATAYLEKEAKGYDAQQARSTSTQEEIKTEPYNTYRAQIEAFSRAVLTGTEPPISGKDGLWNQKIMLAAYQSSRTKKVLPVK